MDLTNFRKAVALLVVRTVQAMKLNRVVFAKLTSVSPIEFSRGTDITFSQKDVAIPYGLTFKREDIGSTHVFIQDDGWQTYIYLYRTR